MAECELQCLVQPAAPALRTPLPRAFQIYFGESHGVGPVAEPLCPPEPGAGGATGPPNNPQGKPQKDGHNQEYAGYVYKNPDGTYSYSPPNPGSEPDTSNPYTGCKHTPEMTYHNHPCEVPGDHANPSEKDVKTAQKGWNQGGVKYPPIPQAISTPTEDPKAPIPVIQVNPVTGSVTPNVGTIQPRK
jgi:hypothetical protein